MANAADIVVNVITKMDSSGMEQAQGKFGKFGSTLKKATVPAIAAAGAIIGIGAASVKSASRLQQAIGSVDAVFDGNAKKVHEWAKGAADSLGLAQSEYEEFAALLGSQLKNAGLPMDQVTEKTKGLIEMGADLAAMYGGTTAEAVEALSSALKGEFDPMEKYGASLSASKVAAEQAAKGTDKYTGKAADQAKALATLGLITKQTSDAQGAAAKEHDSVASRSQQAAANLENLKATLGSALLPAIAAVTSKLSVFLTWLQKNPAAVYALVGAIGALSAAVLVLNVAMLILSANPVSLIIAAVVVAVIALAVGLTLAYKKSETFREIVNNVFASVKASALLVVSMWKAIGRAAAATFNWIKGHWRLIAAIMFGPVGIAVGVITKHWGAIRNAASTLLTWIKTAFRLAFSAISSTVRTYINAAKTVITGIKTAVTGVITKVGDLIAKIKNIDVPSGIKTAIDKIATAVQSVVDAVGDLINKIGDIPTPKIDWPSPPKWFSKLNPFSAVAPSSAPAARMAGITAAAAPTVPRAGRASSSGGMIQINVSGALDPEATARQVKRILTGHNRRVGVRAVAL